MCLTWGHGRFGDFFSASRHLIWWLWCRFLTALTADGSAIPTITSANCRSISAIWAALFQVINNTPGIVLRTLACSGCWGLTNAVLRQCPHITLPHSDAHSRSVTLWPYFDLHILAYWPGLPFDVVLWFVWYLWCRHVELANIWILYCYFSIWPTWFQSTNHNSIIWSISYNQFEWNLYKIYYGYTDYFEGKQRHRETRLFCLSMKSQARAQHFLQDCMCVLRKLRSACSLSACRRIGSFVTHRVPCEDWPDFGTHKLIWVFAGRICTLIGNAVSRLSIVSCRFSFHFFSYTAL